jgi:hypothetical protein
MVNEATALIFIYYFIFIYFITFIYHNRTDNVNTAGDASVCGMLY